MAFIKYHVKNKILFNHLTNLIIYGLMDRRFVRCFSPGTVEPIPPCEVYGPRRFGKCVCHLCCFLRGNTFCKEGVRPYVKNIYDSYLNFPYYYSPGFVKNGQKYNYDQTQLSYYPIEEYRAAMRCEDEESHIYRKMLHRGEIVKERGRVKVPQYCFFIREVCKDGIYKRIHDKPFFRSRKINEYLLKIMEYEESVSDCRLYKEYIIEEDVQIYRAKIARVLI